MNCPAVPKQALLRVARRSVVVGAALLGVALLGLAMRGMTRSPAEKQVHAYLAANRKTSIPRATLAEGLDTNAIPFLIRFATNHNPPICVQFQRLAWKLEDYMPERAAWWLYDAAEKERDATAAVGALELLACRTNGCVVFDSCLKHPDPAVRQIAYRLLRDSAHAGDRTAFYRLTNSLPHEADPESRVDLLWNALILDRTNAALLAELRASTASTNYWARTMAEMIFKLRGTNIDELRRSNR